MNVDEAITTIRARLDDEVLPYLWPQADIISYLNARRNEFARRTRYFRDSATAAICTVTATITPAPVGDYVLDERIITIDRVKGSWSDAPLRKKTVSWMDTYNVGWEATTAGTPVYYLIDKSTGYITVWPKPSTAGTFALTVSRLPSAQLTVASIGLATPATLEVPLLWHENLIEGVLASAYAKPDSQTRNPQKEQIYLVKWENFIADVLMDMTRDRDVEGDDVHVDAYNINELDMATMKWPKFEGLNNKDRPEELKPTELSVARNVDIDKEFRLGRRGGYDDISTLTGSYHSLWAKDGLICLAVKDGNLVRIHEDWSYSTLRGNVGNNVMSYVESNGTVYYTNGTVIGYVTAGVDYQFTDPGMNFKVAPSPGQLIEYFNGRLYIAKDYVLWFTDAMAYGRVDTRKGFKMFPGTIVMLNAVDGGLYTSDDKDTYWLGGASPNAMTLKRVEGAAIPGTAVVVNGQTIRNDLHGSVLFFTTVNGVCMGTSDGQVVNLTKQKYRLPIVQKGAVLVRDESNKVQYVARLYN